jgi:hypothetical protein
MLLGVVIILGAADQSHMAAFVTCLIIFEVGASPIVVVYVHTSYLIPATDAPC